MKNITRNLIPGFLSASVLMAVIFIPIGSVFAAGGPTVSTKSVQYITENSATAVAQVNPNSFNTGVWFEWSNDPNTLSRNQGNKTSPQSVGAGNSPVAVYADLKPLSPDRLYYYRAAAGNSENTVYGSTLTFRTKKSVVGASPEEAPTVTTRNAENITVLSATLKADINPRGSVAVSWFEWGFSSSGLNFITPAQSIGAGKSAVSVLAGLTSLSSSSVYFFRPVVQNSIGTFYGSTKSFKTKAVSGTAAGTGSVTQSNGGLLGFLKPSVTNAGESSSSALMAVNIRTDKTKVQPGEFVVYNIRYRNLGLSDADDAVLKITLPDDLELETTSPLCYAADGDELIFNLGRIESDSEETLAVKIKVNDSSRLGKVLALNTKLNYVDTSSGSKESVSDSLEVAVSAGYNSPMVAAAGFLNGWSSMWLFLTFLLVLTATGYHIYSRRKIHKMLNGE